MILEALLVLAAAASQPPAASREAGASGGTVPASVSPSKGAPAPAGTIERVAWLQGCWESASPNRTVEENWMAPRGKSMIGVGRTVREGALVEYELTVIKEKEGRIAYEAHPSGQPTATFPLRELTDDSVVFENPEHDFPQRVGYRREGSDTLNAWIEGTMNGKTRRVEFPYRRVPCPGK